MKQIVAVICLMLTTLTAGAVGHSEYQTYNAIKTRVINILSERTGIPESQISEDQSFVRDLKMDQVTHEAVRDALSQELGYRIPDEAAEKITTVQRAINYIFIRQQ